MAPNYSNVLFYVTLFCLLILCGLHIASGIRCYHCSEVSECEKSKLGKQGTYISEYDGKEIDRSYQECGDSPGSAYIEGSGYCYARFYNGKIGHRGCDWMIRTMPWNESYIGRECPLQEDGGNVRPLPLSITTHGGWTGDDSRCACFTDLCNGSPTGCCWDDEWYI